MAGSNKPVQEKFWKLINESGWNKYQIVSTVEGADSIVEYILVDNPDFNDLDALTAQIERKTMMFIKDVEGFFI